MNPLKIFISHVTTESAIALGLKEILEGTFPGAVSVFATSSIEDLTPGDRWLQKLERQLKDCQVLLVICSPFSLTRPWINFELGCGWIRGLQIIPICHGGQEKGHLPHPYSSFQALEISDAGFFGALVSSVSIALGLQKPPRIDKVKVGKTFSKIVVEIPTTEAIPEVITSLRDRTKSIIDDLGTLLKSRELKKESVWLSAFLSIWAAGADDHFPDSEQDYLQLLLQERNQLLQLARAGCKIKCIISPPGPNHALHEGNDYASARIRRLIGFLRSSEPALEAIDWAISEVSVRNVYIIGHISCIEGYKVAVKRGYGLTLRQTMPAVIDANINLQAELFDNLASTTERKWGSDQLGLLRRERLRGAAVRCLEESEKFLLTP